MIDLVESNAKAKINALNELLLDIQDDNMQTVSQVNGLIHNTVERLEKHLAGYLENKDE